jgi:hypothetical protein
MVADADLVRTDVSTVEAIVERVAADSRSTFFMIENLAGHIVIRRAELPEMQDWRGQGRGDRDSGRHK